MTQGAPRKNNGTTLPDEFDLDALLYAKGTDPQPITFAGQTWNIRRDLTGAEVLEFWAGINGNKDAEAFGILLGDPETGKEFNAKFNVGLPAEIYREMFARVVKAAGLKRDVESQGESSAS